MTQILLACIHSLILELHTMGGQDEEYVQTITDALERISGCHPKCVIAKFGLVVTAIWESSETTNIIKLAFQRSMEDMELALITEEIENEV